MLELDCVLEFDPSRNEEFFLALPPRPAVCLIEPKEASAEPFFIRRPEWQGHDSSQAAFARSLGVSRRR